MIRFFFYITCHNMFIYTQPDTMLVKMSSWGPDTAGRLARYVEPITQYFNTETNTV